MDIPKEIQDLIDEAVNIIEIGDPNSKFEYKVVEPGPNDDDLWMIWIYIVPVEAYKGPHDGERFTTAFKVDVLRALDLFDEGDQRAAFFDSGHDSDGTLLEVAGDLGKYSAIIHYLLNAPDDVEPEEQIDLGDVKPV